MAANDEDGKLHESPQDEGGLCLTAGDLKTPTDVRSLHLEMINVQRHRVNCALRIERQQGTGLDRSTSTEMRRLNSMVAAYHQFYEPEHEELQRGPSLLAGMLAAVFENKPPCRRASKIR